MIKTRLLQVTDERHSLPLLIKHLLHVPVRQSAEQCLIGHPDGPVSYSNFFKRVSQLAWYLKQAGIKSGDSVALIDWNSYRLPECLFAVPMCGAVLHIVNTSLSSENIADAINKHEDKVVIVHTDFIKEIDKVSGKLESVQEFIVATDGMPVAENNLDPFGRYEDLSLIDAAPFDFPDFRDDSVALASFRYQFGKLVPEFLTHHEIVAQTLASASGAQDAFQLDYHDTFMPILPCLELSTIFDFYLATYLGVKQVYPGATDVRDILQNIEAEGVTYSPVHALQLNDIFERSVVESYRLGQWRISVKENFLPSLKK